MHKEDLALYNLEWLICPKTELNQSNPFGASFVLSFAKVLLFLSRLLDTKPTQQPPHTHEHSLY